MIDKLGPPVTAPQDSALFSVPRRLESATTLDQAATTLHDIAHRVPPKVSEALGGRWLGHPLHPALTDLPIGCWTSAWFLDLIGGTHSRPAAQLLTGLGVLTAVPTIVTGVIAYSGVEDDPSRRVGIVHAIGGAAATGAYAASWWQRRTGHWARGVAWGVLGASVATATASLGGHLAFGPT